MWENRFYTAEEALQALAEARSQCARLTRKLEYLQTKSTAVTGRVSAAPVQGSGHGRSDLWDTLAETRTDLQRQLRSALALEQQVSQWIDSLPRASWRMVLRYRYLDAMNCQEIADEFGFPVYAVVDVYDIIEYLEEGGKNAEDVERIRNYLSVYGAQA